MKRKLRYIIPAAIILILGVAVILFFVLSNGKDKGKEEDQNPTDSTVTEQPSVSDETVDHEFHEYFVMENEGQNLSFSSVSQYEGVEASVIDKDEVHYLLALMTRDLDLYNQVIDTVDVYDLISGEVILSKSVTYDLDADY
ncbi:MAG: hypothetical protein IKA76_05930, partial [Clostridia bacterium]|nr:hypothetical protein [Clostridia bacterium]